MSVTWSYAATGLSIVSTGLIIGHTHLIPAINRPRMYREKLGEYVLGLSGLILTALLFYFGFRLFWDNGFWGILQFLIVSMATGIVIKIRWLQNGLTPLICIALGLAQAIKIF